MADSTTYVLITGANSGIGRATAARLAAEGGYHVFAAMRDVGKADKLMEMAAAAGNDAASRVEPITLDVSDDASVKNAFDDVHGRVEALDVLVNNAGVAWNATVEDIDIEAAKSVFETNYWGCIRCIQGALPSMRARGRGQIINVSSVAGRFASLGQTVYSGSKWALECLSENLVQEVAPLGIRVSVIEPGVTRTAILPKNIGHPEPTVYETVYRRMLQFYTRGIAANVGPEVVADTIVQALQDLEPRFRYVCAWGGEELVAARGRMSDADWIELGMADDDETYYDAFERHLGLDLRLPE